MGRFRKQQFENLREEGFNPDNQYELAYKRVKRIKGFYIHLLVYILINSYIIITSYFHNLHGDEVFLRLETFSTTFFWGIGLLFHGLSVFGKNIFFGQDWEEKKIQEFMDNEKKEKWE